VLLKVLGEVQQRLLRLLRIRIAYALVPLKDL
jgi:hypothetical protein